MIPSGQARRHPEREQGLCETHRAIHPPVSKWHQVFPGFGLSRLYLRQGSCGSLYNCKHCCPWTDHQIFSQQSEFIQEQQRMAMWGMWSNGGPGTYKSRVTKEETALTDLGRAVVNEESLGGNWKVWSMVTFYWLSQGSLSLAELLLLGKEDSFFPPA